MWGDPKFAAAARVLATAQGYFDPALAVVHPPMPPASAAADLPPDPVQPRAGTDPAVAAGEAAHVSVALAEEDGAEEEEAAEEAAEVAAEDSGGGGGGGGGGRGGGDGGDGGGR